MQESGRISAIAHSGLVITNTNLPKIPTSPRNSSSLLLQQNNTRKHERNPPKEILSIQTDPGSTGSVKYPIPSSRPSILCNQSPSKFQHTLQSQPTHQNPSTPPNMAFVQKNCTPRGYATLYTRCISQQNQAHQQMRSNQAHPEALDCTRNYGD